MIEEELEFRIRYIPWDLEVPVHGYEGLTHDHEAFIEICDLMGVSHLRSLIKKEETFGFFFKGKSHENKTQAALSCLKKAGLTPVFTRYVPIDKAWNQFPLLRTSLSERACLDSCEYLRLAYSDARIGYHYTTENNAIIGMLQNDEHAKTADIGAFSPVGLFGVSPDFTRLIEDAKLQGACFNPIRWKKYPSSNFIPNNPKRTNWLSSNNEMPRCLTPRIGFSGDLTGVHFWENEDLIHHGHPHMECGWDDEGRTDFVLRFRRQEVEALKPFDIARTYEWIHLIGETGPRWFPELIVSQRFRQWTKKQRYKLHYGRCELVDR